MSYLNKIYRLKPFKLIKLKMKITILFIYYDYFKYLNILIIFIIDIK